MSEELNPQRQIAPSTCIIAVPPSNNAMALRLVATEQLKGFLITTRSGSTYIMLARTQAEAMATALELAAMANVAPVNCQPLRQ